MLLAGSLVAGARTASYLTVDSLRPSSGPAPHLLSADLELAAPGRAQSFSIEGQAPRQTREG